MLVGRFCAYLVAGEMCGKSAEGTGLTTTDRTGGHDSAGCLRTSATRAAARAGW